MVNNDAKPMVPCPQCSMEQDFHTWMRTESDQLYSEYYNERNPCPQCKGTHSITLIQYLVLMGNARRAFDLEMAGFKKPLTK